jgi:serine/threonine-protein kinase
LVAQPITERASCDEAGKVVAQEPDEDARVSKGTSVALVVASAGTEPVRVPRLVGIRLDDANSASRERRFKIGRVDKRPTNQQPPDTILTQSPKADTLIAPDCPVDVVVAIEIQRIAVPNFIGMTEAQARQMLPRFSIGSSGLALGRVIPQEGRGAPGTVVGQDPAPNTRVEPNTPVTLYVIPQRTSPPPPPPDNLVDVPSMKGWTRSTAVATLQKLELRVEVNYQDVPPPTTRAARVPKHDEVLSQSHTGPVRRGTTIRLTVARVQQPIGE